MDPIKYYLATCANCGKEIYHREGGPRDEIRLEWFHWHTWTFCDGRVRRTQAKAEPVADTIREVTEQQYNDRVDATRDERKA